MNVTKNAYTRHEWKLEELREIKEISFSSLNFPEVPFFEETMNGTLLLVQPRFSHLGHFSHFTLLNARALRGYVPLKTLVYVHGNDSGHEAILNQLSETVETVIVRGSQAGWRIGTWVLYKQTLKLLRAGADIKHILFLDPSLMTLAAGLVFRPLPGACHVTATELFGPELYLADNFVNVSLKRFLFRLATQYRRLKIAPFTPELTASWGQSRLVSPEACLNLPSLQMVNFISPAAKTPISSRAELRFALSGSLRQQKNIERIAPLFRDGVIPGALFLAGAVGDDLTARNLPGLIEGAGERIVCNPHFLSEPELEGLVGKAHYNLLLYIGWDERMESAMLFTSARAGTPIIGLRSGWLGRMITEYELGYTVANPYNVGEIRACLAACALPGSAEYRQFEQGIRRMLADYRHEVVAPKFIAALGIAHK